MQCTPKWTRHGALIRQVGGSGSSTGKLIEQAINEAPWRQDGALDGSDNKMCKQQQAHKPPAGAVLKCKDETGVKADQGAVGPEARVPIRSTEQWEAMPAQERLVRARKRAEFWAAEALKAENEVCGGGSVSWF